MRNKPTGSHRKVKICSNCASASAGFQKMATYATPGERPPASLPSSRETSDQYGEEMDEALVGPVYLRLDDPTFRSYVQYANQTYEEEEAGEEELGLDLSAPPPES